MNEKTPVFHRFLRTMRWLARIKEYGSADRRRLAEDNSFSAHTSSPASVPAFPPDSIVVKEIWEAFSVPEKEFPCIG